MKLSRGERFKEARESLPKDMRSMDSVAAATGVTKSLIQALEDDDNDRDVGYTRIAKLAKHYNVSADYLIGLAPTSTTDISKQEINKLTGLEPKPIDALEMYKMRDEHNSLTRTINALLEDEAALYAIAKYLFYDIKYTKSGPMGLYQEAYKYSNVSAPPYGYKDSFPLPVDVDGTLEAIDNTVYKNIKMLDVQRELQRLLQIEEQKTKR